jgi:hypothetical protein
MCLKGGRKESEWTGTISLIWGGDKLEKWNGKGETKEWTKKVKKEEK